MTSSVSERVPAPALPRDTTPGKTDGLPDMPVDPETARAHVHAVATASGSSFLSAMRLLPRHRREAMFAIYAFCREVDDIADDPLPQAEKTARLSEWRREIDRLYSGRPTTPTGCALLGPIREFDLAREDLIALIDGMEMDATESMRGPDITTLQLYCARVAGAVGLLSIRIFGDASTQARTVAIALGEALQLTNILRDVHEDAMRGRLYLPRELLDRHGVPNGDAAVALMHPALPRVCEDLAVIARQRFVEAEAAMAECRRTAMRPARIMMHMYRRILDGLERRGWTRLDQRVRVPTLTKLAILLRHGII